VDAAVRLRMGPLIPRYWSEPCATSSELAAELDAAEPGWDEWKEGELEALVSSERLRRAREAES
jgi:hypothetical protein